MGYSTRILEEHLDYRFALEGIQSTFYHGPSLHRSQYHTQQCRIPRIEVTLLRERLVSFINVRLRRRDAHSVPGIYRMSGSLSTILQSSNSRHSSTGNTEHLRGTQYYDLCSGRVVRIVEVRTASMIPYGRRASKGTPIVAIS